MVELKQYYCPKGMTKYKNTHIYTLGVIAEGIIFMYRDQKEKLDKDKLKNPKEELLPWQIFKKEKYEKLEY